MKCVWQLAAEVQRPGARLEVLACCDVMTVSQAPARGPPRGPSISPVDQQMSGGDKQADLL